MTLNLLIVMLKRNRTEPFKHLISVRRTGQRAHTHTHTALESQAAVCVRMTRASLRLIVAHLFLIKVSLFARNVGVGVK